MMANGNASSSILPCTRERLINQLNQAREKHQNSESILGVLQQSREDLKKRSRVTEDQKSLLNELEFNIQRQSFLVKRDKLMVISKEEELKNISK
ncbi:hypothetical protein BY996DRAFT_4239193 [Phakopsora pachyrhizi]|uniref:Uncharacterized protein n=1 Tax=Phakopsora pachyrhizi TaxID=170000 RepID=A0AAV0BT55_PHAPC|nr:hypothetical protein BY996DRAFT_4239193 [Phakopsora pachyrhizi]CAH7689889.1 hypothetical protein PPACK8108_LOCUS25060 [Phakopsora pachyrhizi]